MMTHGSAWLNWMFSFSQTIKFLREDLMRLSAVVLKEKKILECMKFKETNFPENL